MGAQRPHPKRLVRLTWRACKRALSLLGIRITFGEWWRNISSEDQPPVPLSVILRHQRRKYKMAARSELAWRKATLTKITATTTKRKPPDPPPEPEWWE